MENKGEEIQEAYDSWHLLLQEKLKDLEYFLSHVKSDLRNAGLHGKQVDIFVEHKVNVMRQEIKSGMKVRRRAQ